MKKLIFLILFLGACVALLPYGTGLYIQQQAKKVFEHETNDIKVEYALTRGYSSSELITTVTFNQLMQSEKDLPIAGFKVHQTIIHGLGTFQIKGGRIILAKSKSTLQLIPLEPGNTQSGNHQKWVQEISKYYPNLELLFMETDWYLNGSGQTEFLLPKMAGNYEGMDIVFSGIEGIVRHDASFHKLKASWQLNEFKIQQQNPSHSIQLQNLKGEHHVFTNSLQQWLGQTSFALGNLLIAEQQKNIFTINDVLLESHAKEIPNTNNLDLSFTLMLESLKATGVHLSSSKMTWILSNLHAPTLHRLDTLSRQPNGQEVIQKEMDELGKKMLHQRPKASVKDFILSFPEGDLTLEGYLEVGGPEISDINDLSSIIKSLVGEISFSSPKAIILSVLRMQAIEQVRAQRYIYESLKQQSADVTIPAEVLPENEAQTVNDMVSKQLQKMLSQSILVEDENQYFTRIEIKNGQMDMNGVVSPLSP